MHLELNPLTVEKAWRADHISELLDHFTKACRFMTPNRLMVQELIPGGGESQYSYSGLFIEGQPIAAVVARRARQYPSDFGRFSTFVETIEEPALQIPAFKILNSIDFTGLVEVEFKRDARDGRYKLLDMNPRIWGWHSLCTSAGVDFSYLLWKMVRGEALPKVTARAGIRWARLGPDILVGISEICKGRLSLPEYLRSLLPPLVTPIFALDDPVPALVELPNLGYLLLVREMRHGWQQSASSFKKALALFRRQIGQDDTAKDPPA
jgi:predicted ATP-grasp superfamily ATP-dependent carboligase